ncbi:MAG: response regulator transcription factor [Actinobacteria bacterium]|nr:response regulator transcription factor [Actinomycetota bacterium]
MKLRALIVDDEPPARSELRYMLDNIEEIEVVGESASVKEALELIRVVNYDVVFLDIQMPGLTGLEMAQALRQLSNSPLIVFVTAHGEHAVRAFEVDAVDYLLKPFEEDRLMQTINRLIKIKTRMEAKPLSEGQREAAKFDRMPVEKNGKTILLNVDSIIYADIRHDYVYIHTYDESFITTYTLAELEGRLKDRFFFRTHRSYVVNLNKVKEIVPLFKNNYVLKVKDKNESEILVSRRQTRKLKALLGI